ncbi:RHS repeat-associated core domain-containing protein, partial [Candidatus Woesearchaeota archaeon]|nr:RHS repeat-associated core domain-containing protein [Candidatus Woesearchaeota archaeon]
ITYYLDSVVVQKVNNSITETTYIYDDSRLIASEENNVTQFYLTDHQGSVDAVVDSSGNLLYDLEYLPFGLSYQDNESRFTFTGKELDLSGLMYYESRYYSPFLRRFTQPDSVIPALYDTQSLNRYSYVRNNPVVYIDPTGHFWETLWDIFSVGWDIKDIISDPTSLLSWGALGLDLLAVIIPGIPAVGQLAKLDKFVDAAKGTGKVADVVKGLDKTNDVAKGLDKIKDSSKVYGDVFEQLTKNDEIVKLPVEKLQGHTADDAISLFREGAKTHVDEPITAFQIGDKYLINDGVGRTSRAIKNGETVVNGKIIGTYANEQILSDAVFLGEDGAKGIMRDWKRSENIFEQVKRLLK